MTRRRVVLATIVLVATAVAVSIARSYVHGLSLVVRIADLEGNLRHVAKLNTTAVGRSELEIPVGGAMLRAQASMPAWRVKRTALLVTGLHPAGIDEPRLTRLAGELAASDVGAVTPEIPDLARFAVTPAITDAIEQAATWLASDVTFAPDGRVGMLGISFSGGLSIRAAGRLGLRDRLAYVFSFGDHADLPRVVRYLCTGVEEQPADDLRVLTKHEEGRYVPPPHDYGVVVNPARDGRPTRAAGAGRAASRRGPALSVGVLPGPRRQTAGRGREFAVLRALAPTLPEPSSTLLDYVDNRDVVHLGARLLPHLSSYGEPAPSASRSPRPSAPVLLLHGIDDNVIPAVESVPMVNDLLGQAPVRLLLAWLVSHAEIVRPARAGDILRLARFSGDVS